MSALIDILAATPVPPSRQDEMLALLGLSRDAGRDRRVRERHRVFLAQAARGEQREGRLRKLRHFMKAAGLEGCIVPMRDRFNSEYPPLRDRRLLWLAGFSGSAGMAIVLTGRAAFFSDGRYALQMEQELDTRCFEPLVTPGASPADWLVRHAAPGDRIGFNPWLFTRSHARQLEDTCRQAGLLWTPLAEDPVDAVREDIPPPPRGPVTLHPVRFSGMESIEKRRQIAREVARAGADAALITQPESVAWLLNIRGCDLPHTPVPLSLALIDREGLVSLMIDREKIPPGSAGQIGARLYPLAGTGEVLGAFRDRTVMIDPASCPVALDTAFARAGVKIIERPDPVALPRACKNPVEVQGAASAHLRDGVAVCRFLAWLARKMPPGGVTECAAAGKLESLRAENPEFIEPSFPTISAFGPNGAIVHYRPDPQAATRIRADGLYLCDSGGQYRDGTTDITRTVAIGTPEAGQIDHYSRVLAGHAAVVQAVFPGNCPGSRLDALARLPLWQAGLDFSHGVGHGVGSWLSVHEGPQSISFRSGDPPLRPGMILSVEPGCYRTGAYGIRLENLVVVTPSGPVAGGEISMFCFRVLSLAPFDRALIDPGLLPAAARDWVDGYHDRVFREISPFLDPDERQWLREATLPLSAPAPQDGAALSA